jgi:hypothetical protein
MERKDACKPEVKTIDSSSMAVVVPCFTWEEFRNKLPGKLGFVPHRIVNARGATCDEYDALTTGETYFALKEGEVFRAGATLTRLLLSLFEPCRASAPTHTAAWHC